MKKILLLVLCAFCLVSCNKSGSKEQNVQQEKLSSQQLEELVNAYEINTEDCIVLYSKIEQQIENADTSNQRPISSKFKQLHASLDKMYNISTKIEYNEKKLNDSQREKLKSINENFFIESVGSDNIPNWKVNKSTAEEADNLIVELEDIANGYEQLCDDLISLYNKGDKFSHDDNDDYEMYLNQLDKKTALLETKIDIFNAKLEEFDKVKVSQAIRIIKSRLKILENTTELLSLKIYDKLII